VPVFLPRFEEHAVTGPNQLDRRTAALAQAETLRHVDGLPVGGVCQAVRAPGVKWTLLADRRDPGDGVATVST
jgi:hypothetical protein